MGRLNYSRQRESIEAFLKTRYDHPTADVVYQHIRMEYPNISLGTVYRNLSLLASLNRVRAIDCGDGIVHFDADTTPHYHFRCRKCGCLLDMEAGLENELDDFVSKHKDFLITGRSLLFEGFCHSCIPETAESHDKSPVIS